MPDSEFKRKAKIAPPGRYGFWQSVDITVTELAHVIALAGLSIDEKGYNSLGSGVKRHFRRIP